MEKKFRERIVKEGDLKRISLEKVNCKGGIKEGKFRKSKLQMGF